MQNRKYFPFERNNYYFGKLLTSKDFEAEQRYLNDKRRFVNALTGANGIAAGLGVVMADDTSVIIQAGCAMDASGREIVVPETKVVKLSTIEGYDELTTACAYLGISYEEQQADEVYAAMNNSGGLCYNKMRETFKLTLLDESLAAKIERPLDEFVTALTVYSDNEVTVTQYTPKFAAKGNETRILVEIQKTGQGTGEYSFGYTLEAPGFVAADGESSVAVSLSGLKLAHGESASAGYTLTPKTHIWGGGETAVTVSGFVIQKNGEGFSLSEKLECRLKPVGQDIVSHYLSSYYQKSMDKELTDSYDNKLWIAKISLFRQKNSVIIDRVYPAPFGQYVYNAGQLMCMRELERFYPTAGIVRGAASAAAESDFTLVNSRGIQPDFAKSTACGVFDIGLGLGYSTREPVFSEEIMHGLGKGPVYVEVGVEYITTDAARGIDNSEIILGDVNLFASEGRTYEDERIYNVSTAVKILPERGTFVVGLLPREASGLISLRIRWFAVRMTEVSKQISAAHDGEKYILINPDTIVVPPKGTAHISPVFINMPTEACSFKLVDAEGGSIDNNGVYTAPAKEGVYEIRVEAVSDPSIYTHAFAIVTQKKKDTNKS
ncbi:MAG: hypothetical protein FWH02_02625 [Oscillospiraceae bacterium]|nr:hypothetical protein [Oscillospiraceae bacterium]